MALPMPHHRFNVDEYEEMIKTGILVEDDRVELIHGEIIAMSPIGASHAECVTTLLELLFAQKPISVRVTAQNPVRLPDDSEPQPDVMIMRAGRYRRTLPTAGDVLVVIEVSETTRVYDRKTKFPIYAAAGIPEAWLVDLTALRIERHTDPWPDGYHSVARFGRGKFVESTVVSGLAVSADAVLGLDE